MRLHEFEERAVPIYSYILEIQIFQWNNRDILRWEISFADGRDKNAPDARWLKWFTVEIDYPGNFESYARGKSTFIKFQENNEQSAPLCIWNLLRAASQAPLEHSKAINHLENNGGNFVRILSTAISLSSKVSVGGSVILPPLANVARLA